ncbi:ABC transporter permease [Confluentibacter lentus]|uniref:ABC transporter permease n=1 Tax=Confluentibacter lentus TaxID=1699412 RepID=UPI001E3FFEDA|nr:FtsX-like permease family protein [Confluentibacter lentus]
MVEKTNVSKAGLVWLLKMAWRDGKSSWKKLMLFMASIVLGIAALVSIQSFSDNLKRNIASQSKSLMGSDFKIDSDKAPSDSLLVIMDSLGGFDSREISFASMVAFPNQEGSKLAQVRGIEGDFPFYGAMETEPVLAATTYQEQRTALVDATLMLQFGLKPGDTIKIGNATLPIGGALKSVAGSNSLSSSIAPPVVIPYSYIEASGLVQTGSRLDYEFYFVAKPGTDLELLNEALSEKLHAIDADLDIHTSTSERLGRRYDNFGKFLNLVAFIALLLGCVGIASAVHIYIKEKLRSIAILKCLGATKKQTFLIYLLQIGFVGLVSGFIGALVGLFLQQLFPLILEGLLPVEVEITLVPTAIYSGILLGVFMSVLFALYPLIGTIYTSPLQTLRIEENNNSKSTKAGLLVLAAIFSFIFLFAYCLLKDITFAFAFLIGIIITFLILGGIAHGFMKTIKKFFPHSWGFVARTSMLNLYRPKNQTLVLVMTIGVGTFLISTLYFSKNLLLAQASIERKANSANMILLDIQNEQIEQVASIITDNSYPLIDNIPIVTMRIHSIDGKTVNEIREDTTSTIRRWVLSHEFRVTYRNSLTASETLQSGTFTPEVTTNNLVPISVSDNFVEDTNVTIGDNITFNVQGVLINTVVGSIRAVDWSTMQPNFTVLFPRGVLENAPQFRVITTNVPNEQASAILQQELVTKFPNVSILDLRQILNMVEKLLDKIGWIINFMAFFSILTGIIVLIGAVRTSKHQRIRESVLLRTLGAKSNQILKMIALEYTYLGIIGSLTGILLSLVSSQLLALWIFKTPFTPSIIPFVVLFPLITLLVVGIGLANSRSVINNTPLEVLRKENN